jgi:rhodanese-related sulfurtransferase
MSTLFGKSSVLSAILIMVFVLSISIKGYNQSTDTLQVHLSAAQCYNLIQLNSNNPNLVILDVRRPSEHIPQHLQGAINRDFYAADFNDLIDSLPKHKMYVIYCKSGGRSGQTFNLMLSMNFTNIVNMLGGINAWIGESLPTTAVFNPMQMAVSDTIVNMDTINIGNVDTIDLMITNRANDTLKFISITSLIGSEFSTDFDTTTILLGAEDYSFSIFYEPNDQISDSVSFLIESNGGNVVFHIWRTGVMPVFEIETVIESKLKIYPNPFTTSTTIEYELIHPETVTYTFYNQFGKQVDIIEQKQSSGLQQVIWTPENLADGIYYFRLEVGKQTASGKLILMK